MKDTTAYALTPCILCCRFRLQAKIGNNKTQVPAAAALHPRMYLSCIYRTPRRHDREGARFGNIVAWHLTNHDTLRIPRPPSRCRGPRCSARSLSARGSRSGLPPARRFRRWRTYHRPGLVGDGCAVDDLPQHQRRGARSPEQPASTLACTAAFKQQPVLLRRWPRRSCRPRAPPHHPAGLAPPIAHCGGASGGGGEVIPLRRWSRPGRRPRGFGRACWWRSSRA